jgi:hypothetical protein
MDVLQNSVGKCAVKVCCGKYHGGDWCLHHYDVKGQMGTDMILILKWY